MVIIKFYFPDNEEISEYSLGDIDISNDEKLISSKGDSRKLMMVFISLSDFSDGIVNLIHKKSQKEYEFIGTGSSFRLLINCHEDRVFINNPQQKTIVDISCAEVVKALWECWQDIEKYITELDKKSSVYLDLVSRKDIFEKAFANII